MKIQNVDEINWTPIIAIFTVMSTALGGFWAWCTFYFRDKALQRKEFLESIASKVVSDKIIAVDERINSQNNEHIKQLENIWNEVKDMRKTFQKGVDDINSKLYELMKDLNR